MKRTLTAALALGLMACGGDESQSGAPTVTPQSNGGLAGSIAPSVTPPTNTTPVASGAAGAPSSTPPEPSAKPTEPAPTAGGTQYCSVRKVLDSRCTACHNEQKVGGAPMSLKTYADLQLPAISDRTKKVFQVVGVRVHDKVKPMPPQEKLTAEQLSSIDTWVAAGGPEGSDPTCGGTISDKPTDKPTTTPGEGTTGFSEKCDEVYTIKAHGTGGATSPYMVPAGQEIHPKISIPAPWGNEEVQMVAMRALSDNKKVLHHWILYGSQREFLVGWAPGKDMSAPLPPDVGMHMPGGTLTLDMHYYNLMGTQAEPDNSGLELCVLKKANFRPKTATVNQTFSQFLINIPARATNFNVTGMCTFTGQSPATLITASPHAHTMAKHMKFTVTKKSGETIVMHDEDFDFNEQTSYPLTPAVTLENGDVVTTTCTYDNPTDRAVTFGENTGNEMCFNFAVYYPMGGMACGSGSFTGPGR
ncbi:MAG TPA: hypothetical protein VJV78_05510 [Polyangiales bacterium]|nr:hypothetical protein [Polyangiales bacterium]